MTRIIRAVRRGPSPPKKPSPERARVISAREQRARTEAERIIARARAEARSILEQAQTEAMEIQQRAAEAGRAQAARLIVATEEHSRRRAREAGKELIDLATKMAEKILGEQLQRDPRLVTTVARQCLAQGAGARRITLRVHPADLPLVEEALPWLQEEADAEVLLLAADETVARGGCILDTELGQIDGGLQTQLQAIQQALDRK